MLIKIGSLKPGMTSLEEIAGKIELCQKCPLYKTRNKPVPGEGPSDARVMLVGEAPGRNEDLTGRPFVGQAGKFLDQLLGLAGLSREEVFIGNVVKCRPPGNRDPLPMEIEACSPWLDMQFQVISPIVVVTLGRFSMRHFQDRFQLAQDSISKVHGRPTRIDTLVWHGWLVPMYHPAAGLYRGEVKEKIVEDWKKFGQFLSSIKTSQTKTQ